MYFKHLILVFSAAAMASALPSVGTTPPPPTNIPAGVWNQTTKKCDVGKLECCNSFQQVTQNIVQSLAGAVGGAIGSVSGMIGVNCNNAGAFGQLGGNSCSASPACCAGNSFTGIGTVGCTPIHANA